MRKLLLPILLIFITVNCYSQTTTVKQKIIGKWKFSSADIFPSSAHFNQFEELEFELRSYTFIFTSSTNCFIIWKESEDFKWKTSISKKQKLNYKILSNNALQFSEITDFSSDLNEYTEIPIIKISNTELVLKVTPRLHYNWGKPLPQGDYFYFHFKKQ